MSYSFHLHIFNHFEAMRISESNTLFIYITHKSDLLRRENRIWNKSMSPFSSAKKLGDLHHKVLFKNTHQENENIPSTFDLLSRETRFLQRNLQGSESPVFIVLSGVHCLCSVVKCIEVTLSARVLSGIPLFPICQS